VDTPSGAFGGWIWDRGNVAVGRFRRWTSADAEDGSAFVLNGAGRFIPAGRGANAAGH